MNTLKKQIYLLKNEIQNYAWGQTNAEAFIPQLLGFQPERDTPYAELWIGAHTKAPSKILDTDLYKLIEIYPNEILGEKFAEKFDGKLPFLMKVLTAGEALSIQAHPNKAQAEVLHKDDPEHYPDDNHKPEIAIALDDLTALVGFKTLDEIVKLLVDYSPISEFVSDNAIKNLNTATDTKEALKKFYSEIMLKSEKSPDELEIVLQKMDTLIVRKEQLSEVDELYIELREKYGTDVGLFSLYLFNLVHLKAGEAVFLKAGIPHAYLKGNIIECMANSDNVVRAGLTPKFKDVETLIEVLTYETGIPKIMKADANAPVNVYKVPIPEFTILKKTYTTGTIDTITTDQMEIFIITEGSIVIMIDGKSTKYKKGDTLLKPAFLESYQLEATETSTLYSAIIAEE